VVSADHGTGGNVGLIGAEEWREGADCCVIEEVVLVERHSEGGTAVVRKK
jgi:hypothetical protein